ncbi:amidase [Apiospora phragmitis]|uniref:Amidase n=1 Tax=Apiospora phragmitis TaxID=2905665 RepID=A0ABR1SV95_9PEZI
MEPWRETAEKKQKSLLSKIPEPRHLLDAFCAIPTTLDSPNLNVTTDVFMSESGLSPRELCITSNISIPTILANYKSQELSAEELVTAFCHRAAINHQMTESLAEIRFTEAIAEAKGQDEYLRTHKKLVGPLHGIPVSLKDQFRVERLETAMGYIGWLGSVETAESESLLTQQIRELGGITHVPQTLMLAELQSNLHRPGLNPHNRLLSPGGSSGGEGSLLASRGSVVGIGTDMGGLIRIPSAFNHLFGLKPSSGRFSYRGLANSLGGKPVVPSVAGPMSTTLENLIHLTQAVIDAEGWRRDPALVPLRWRTEVLDQVRAAATAPRGGLCFAGFAHGDDSITRLHPPVARGVEMAVRAARQAGHRVIEWQPPSHAEATLLYAGLVFATSYDVDDALKLSGEPLIGGAEAVFRAGEKYRPKSMQEYYELVRGFRKYQEDYADYCESTKSLTGTGRPVDGIIAPVAATAAVRHDSFYAFRRRFVPDDAAIYHGAPVGVQVVARRLEEEKVLALGEVLSNALNVLSARL